VSKTEVSRIPMSCLRRTASHNHITTTATPPLPQHTTTSHRARVYFFLVVVYSRLGPWTRPLHPAHLTKTTTTTKPCVSVELCVNCSKETTTWIRSSYVVLQRPPSVQVVGALNVDCYPSRVSSTKTIKRRPLWTKIFIFHQQEWPKTVTVSRTLAPSKTHQDNISAPQALSPTSSHDHTTTHGLLGRLLAPPDVTCYQQPTTPAFAPTPRRICTLSSHRPQNGRRPSL